MTRSEALSAANSQFPKVKIHAI